MTFPNHSFRKKAKLQEENKWKSYIIDYMLLMTAKFCLTRLNYVTNSGIKVYI